jgi:hypothetical protein
MLTHVLDMLHHLVEVIDAFEKALRKEFDGLFGASLDLSSGLRAVGTRVKVVVLIV